MLEAIKAFLAKWATLIAVIGAAIAWYVFRARGLKVDALQAKISALLIEKQLAKLEEKKVKDEEAFKEHLATYDELKRKHAELAKKLGLGPVS